LIAERDRNEIDIPAYRLDAAVAPKVLEERLETARKNRY